MERAARVFKTEFAAVLALTFFIFVLAPVCRAEPPDCKGKDKGSGECIRNKFDEVFTKQEIMAEKFKELPGFKDNPDRQQRLENAVRRNRSVHDRSDADDFKQLTRKRKQRCDWVELIDDGVGNDDGVCDPGEGCQEYCEDDYGQTDVGSDLEDSLDDVSGAYDVLNEELTKYNESPQAALASLPALSAGPLTEAQYSILFSRMPPALMLAMSMTVEVADTVRDVGERICDQTSAGFNAAVVCAALEGLFHVVRGGYVALELMDNDVNSAEIEGAYKRAKDIWDRTGEVSDAVAELQGDVNGISSSVETLGGNLGALDGKVNVMQGQLTDMIRKLQDLETALQSVQQLLLAPQGRRPGFPQKANP